MIRLLGEVMTHRCLCYDSMADLDRCQDRRVGRVRAVPYSSRRRKAASKIDAALCRGKTLFKIGVVRSLDQEGVEINATVDRYFG